jgi:hypothetical protein
MEDKYTNVLNRVIGIEDYNGNTIMAIEIDEKGNIVKMENCSIADIDGDTIFDTNKELMRLQADEEF